GKLAYMRAPSGIYDSKLGSITFFGDVPKGTWVQVTETNRNDILAASKTSMEEALEHYPGHAPSAALLFSCASRRQILGSRTIEEYQLIQLNLRNDLPACGFYTNGEIAPLQQHGQTYFHNETFVTVLIGES
ncbi:MAG: FIST C-terminal domain-containing protein, partial [Leptolyngbyaceae bacterium]|nr:FIST C-terminal domain-containing protein [Leptolyngbyaceae bacterium]